MSRARVMALALLASVGGACEKTSGAPAPGAPAAPPSALAVDASHLAAPRPPHQDEPQEHEELPTKVQLSAGVVKAAGIRTALVGLDSLPATIDLTGELAADPDRSARLTARVSGRIVEVRAREGDRVKAGQVVATLESPEVGRARAALTSAMARARVVRLNAERLRALESRSLASGQELAGALAEAAALEAEVTAARQTLASFGQAAEQVRGDSARIVLRTPLSGFVLARDAVQGQTVTAEHVVAVVGDLDHVYFLGRLFEKDLGRVKVGAAAEVRLNAYPDDVLIGKVETIGRQLDPAARTVTARILVRNHADLVKVGLFGTARVVVGAAEGNKRTVIPLSAVTRVADKEVAFVRQSDGDFELHPVTLGRTAAGRVEILSGLRAGEAVVVDGVFTLKSAILKGTFGEED